MLAAEAGPKYGGHGGDRLRLTRSRRKERRRAVRAAGPVLLLRSRTVCSERGEARALPERQVRRAERCRGAIGPQADQREHCAMPDRRCRLGDEAGRFPVESQDQRDRAAAPHDWRQGDHAQIAHFEKTARGGHGAWRNNRSSCRCEATPSSPTERSTPAQSNCAGPGLDLPKTRSAFNRQAAPIKPDAGRLMVQDLQCRVRSSSSSPAIGSSSRSCAPGRPSSGGR